MERLTEYLGGIPHIKRTINGINSKANYLRDFDIEAVKKLAAYEDTGMEPEEVKAKCAWADNVCKMLSGIFEDSGVFDFSHIKELITAEQEGRLIVLPCKVGDTVYVVGYCGEIYTHRDWETGAQECPFEGDCELEECDDNTLRVFETTCDGFVLDKLDKKLHITLKSIGLDSGDVLGERVFLTRAEAEKAMEVSEDA